jgi:tryptophanyl-tRNA synthetase
LTETPLVPGLDGRKMSKSYNNGLDLSEESSALSKKIKAMPTDPQRALRENPGNPEVCNVFTYHKLFSSPEDVAWADHGCRTAGIGCGDCKARLLVNIEKLIAEPRERKKELLNNPKRIDELMHAGNEKARLEAGKNLRQIKDWMKLK